MPHIITAKDQWTPVSSTVTARIWDGKLWRREIGPQFYGGYQIKYCSLDSAIGREWLAEFGADAPEVTATCSAEIADWLDPGGALRRAGLLAVQS